MKNRFVRVTVVTIIISLFYFMFFTEKLVDKPEVKSSNIGSDQITQKVDTLLNQNDYLVIGKPNDVKLVKVTDTINYQGYLVINVYKDDAIIAKKEDKDDMEVYKKFPSQSQFEEHKVDLYKGKLADPDFSTNLEAKMFITRITEACKELGVNFAGHYTLTYWGCGTSCQYGVVVDRKTGQVFDGYQTSLGSEFRKDSKFIIMNSDILEATNEYIPLYQLKKFRLEIWDGKKFVAAN